jgi:hypothetical protein
MSGSDLHALIEHEIGHSWFPMIVRSNERRDAWMNEDTTLWLQAAENKTKLPMRRYATYAIFDHATNVSLWGVDTGTPITALPAAITATVNRTSWLRLYQCFAITAY